MLDLTEKSSAPVYLVGDIVFKMSHISTLLGVTKYEEVVRLIFHTGMEVQRQKLEHFTDEQTAKMKLLPGEKAFVFTKDDLDSAYKDKRYVTPSPVLLLIAQTHWSLRFPKNFRIEFIYKQQTSGSGTSALSPALHWEEDVYEAFLATVRVP